MGSNNMQPVLFNQKVAGANSTQADTVLVALHNAISPYTGIDSAKTIVGTNGTAIATFTTATTGSSYWIAVKHRNALETWSAAPVLFSTNTAYDFTTALSQAYGTMFLRDGWWMFYSGDINRDGNIDLVDFPPLDNGITGGNWGAYFKEDLNGDGNVDLLDFPILDANIISGIFSAHPH